VQRIEDEVLLRIRTRVPRDQRSLSSGAPAARPVGRRN
jgi:hypothetical protein